ncbi:hypothetical protein ACJMK2_041192 [Sinanodonta woodiana]|uniref:Uncharacterized protein n=1 Tax=Sinanodonta woodiana TaxID=1069815 RepID=A0ABD3W4C2_SINWO
MLVVVLVVILKSHQAESSQSSVQALAGNYKIDADEGKCLCWKEDASCKEPYCYYENTDIAVLESLHQIPNNMDCPLDNAGCTGKLLTCNSLESNRLRCLEDCDELKEQIINNTYSCDKTLKCCQALPCMKELLNSTGNRSKQITSYFCINDDWNIIPKALCSPGWIGDYCDQPRNKNITCKCYKSKSNSFCVNYENCSEMMFVSNISSLCRKNNLTHCLNQSKVCKSQYGGRDQCLCDIENKELADQDLCWRTEDPCREEYFNKTNGAITVPALERVHKIDQLQENCDKIKEKTDEDLKRCNGNRIVDNYEMAEKLLDKECVEVIKCCHVRNYGLKYFNVSGNGNHQIASVICKNYEEKTPPPIFQCQQGWRGDRCNETYQIQIGCRCFQSYSWCENTTGCLEMMYLEGNKFLCSKHNLTHCEFASDVCRTKIQGKECLCNVDTHMAEVSEMKSQSNLMNGTGILGQFTGIFARNILAIAIYFVLVHLHQSK